jgi:hypothetical protein
MLNQHVYTNIIRSLAISTNTVVTDEVKKYSQNMAKRFVDNVRKNKSLQEVVDYTIENEQPVEQETQESEDVDVPVVENQEPAEQEQPVKNKKSVWTKVKDFLNNLANKIDPDETEEYDVDQEQVEDIQEPVIIGPSGEVESEETSEETVEPEQSEGSVAIPEESTNPIEEQQEYVEGEPVES